MSGSSSNAVPRLRFEGFSAQADVFELGKITKVIDCKHRTPKYVNEGVPIVSPGSIKWGKIDLVSPSKRVTEEDYKSLMDHCEPNVGDLVLSRNQSLGIACYITSNAKFVLGQDTVLIQQKDGNGMLIFHRLQTSETQNLISRLSGGSTFSRINLKDIRLLPLTLPTEEDEQRKIADFLTAVDNRIEQLIQKKALLEDYKKGVMQQLFTQANRFKDDDGKDFPDWEEKKLGELCKIKTGKKDVNEGNPNGKYPFFTCARQHTFSDNYSFDTTAILIAGNGEVGHCRFYKGKFEAYQRTYVLSEFSRSVEYIFPYLNFFFRRAVDQQKQMGAMPYIKLGMLSDFPVPVPSDPIEQTKIARFVAAIDRKIESVATQITETQTFKRGLLQQMFV